MSLQWGEVNIEHLKDSLTAFKGVCAAQAEKESLKSRFALNQISREDFGRGINECFVRLNECDARLSKNAQLRRALLKMKNVYDHEPESITLDDFQRFLGL